MGKTIFDKIWDKHVVKIIEDGPSVLYIDKHLIHEVTSPQAFSGIEKRGAQLFRPKQIVATADHNVPTMNQHLPIADQLSKFQVDTLIDNCKKHGVELYGLGHEHQGIVHVIGPELGITQPGMTIVCGDSHTSTHGAFGSIAFGIGTSEVEMVFASQCVMQSKPKVMRINIDGAIQNGVVSKDIILFIIAQISASGATGYFVEYAGSAIRALSMEARMTICNMTIEGGARAGLIAPDEKIFNYLKGKPMSPHGDNWDKALNYWNSLKTDANASFDQELNLNAEEILPMITWGTSPQDVITIDGKVPNPQSENDEDKKNSIERSLKYMGLKPDMAVSSPNGAVGIIKDVSRHFATVIPLIHSRSLLGVGFLNSRYSGSMSWDGKNYRFAQITDVPREAQFKIGDTIKIHDKDFPLEAVIEDIGAFQLHLRLDNGNLVTYPNNLMLQKGVTLIEKDALDEDYD